DRGYDEHGSARLGALSHRYRGRDEHPEPGPDPEDDRGRTAPGGRAARAFECPAEARDNLHQPIRRQHPADAATPVNTKEDRKDEREAWKTQTVGPAINGHGHYVGVGAQAEDCSSGNSLRADRAATGQNPIP